MRNSNENQRQQEVTGMWPFLSPTLVHKTSELSYPLFLIMDSASESLFRPHCKQPVPNHKSWQNTHISHPQHRDGCKKITKPSPCFMKTYSTFPTLSERAVPYESPSHGMGVAVMDTMSNSTRMEVSILLSPLCGLTQTNTMIFKNSCGK